jgi:hypothetical protein
MNIIRDAQKAIRSSPVARAILRRVTFVRIVILVWLYIVYWAERTVFRSSIDECDWPNWEKWV